MDLIYPDVYDYKSIKFYTGKQITLMGDSPLNLTIALTMILIGEELICCRNSSLESKLFLSVHFIHFPDTVLTVILIFLIRTHVNTSSFRRSWLARSYGDATLDGPGFPLCP